jgi:hypothetical protein
MRFTSWFAVGVAVLIGCSPGKELPSKPPEHDNTSVGPPPAPTIPTKSEDAAREVVTRAVAAFTKNDPGKLAKVKAARVSMTGQMNSGQWVSVSRAMLGEWPDKFRGVWTFDAPGFQPATALLNGSSGSYRGGAGQAEALSPGRLQELRWDSTAQLWLPLLIPLTDPATVLYAAGTEAIDRRTLRTVKASAPGYPVWTLAFDPGSGLLLRVDYEGMEAGQARHKAVAFSEHAEKEGLLVPAKWEVFLGGTVTEVYRLTEFALPDKLDPKEFQDQ